MWSKLEHRLESIAVCNFLPVSTTGDKQLTVLVGDTITLIEEHPSGWYHGIKLNNKGVYESGIFPSACVHIKEKEFNEAENESGLLPKLLEETKLILKEWGIQLKANLMNNNDDITANVFDCFKVIMKYRRQLVSEQLSQNQIEDICKEVYRYIDRGNKQLGLGILARDTNFMEPQVEEQSALKVRELYNQKNLLRKHSIAANRMKSVFITQSSLEYPGFHLFLDLKAFIASIGTAKELNHLFFSIYDSNNECFLTDEYQITLTFNGMPVDEEKIGKIRCLFTDLTDKEISNGDLYLVCRIYREGRMNVSEKLSGGDSKLNYFRPFGVSVFSISGCVLDDLTENYMKIYTPNSEHLFPHLHQNIIQRQGGFETHPKAEGLCVSLRMYQGDRKTLANQHALLKEAVQVSRFGHPESQLYHDCAVPEDPNMQVESFFGRGYTRLYVQLKQGEFSQGFKSAAKNVQVTVRLRSSLTGEFFLGVFPNGDKYESCVYYHSNTPKWNENVAIDIPNEVPVDQCHLFITFKHCSSDIKHNGKDSSNIFAFTFLPIMNPVNNVFLPSENYRLTLFKYDANLAHPNVYIRQQWLPLPEDVDDKNSNVESSEGSNFVRAYNKIPVNELFHSRRKASVNLLSKAVAVNESMEDDFDFEKENEAENPNLPGGLQLITSFNTSLSSGTKTSDKLRQHNMHKLIYSKDQLSISTLLVSNQCSSNVHLCNLLRWDTRKFTVRLNTILKDYVLNVSTSEMLTFFPLIFDALFDIMKSSFRKVEGNSALSGMQTLIFSALIHTLHSISHARYQKAIGPMVDFYVNHIFDSATNGVHILLSLIYMLKYKSSSKEMRNSFKIIGVLLKFVNRAYSLYENKEEFQGYLNEYFGSLESLLATEIEDDKVNSTPSSGTGTGVLEVTKLLAIQHFPDILLNVRQMYNDDQLAAINLSFCSRIPVTSSKFITHQLKLFDQIIDSNLFCSRHKVELISFIAGCIKSHLALYIEVDKRHNLVNTPILEDVVNSSHIFSRLSVQLDAASYPASPVENIEEISKSYSAGQLDTMFGLSMEILARITNDHMKLKDAEDCVNQLSVLLPNLISYYGYNKTSDALNDDDCNLKTLILTLMQILPSDIIFRDCREPALMGFYVFLEDCLTSKSLEYTMVKYSRRIVFKVLLQLFEVLKQRFCNQRIDISIDECDDDLAYVPDVVITPYDNCKLKSSTSLWSGLFLLLVEYIKCSLATANQSEYYKLIYPVSPQDINPAIELLSEVWSFLRGNSEVSSYKHLVRSILELVVMDQTREEMCPVDHESNYLSRRFMDIYVDMLLKESRSSGNIQVCKHETIRYFKGINIKDTFNNFFRASLSSCLSLHQDQEILKQFNLEIQEFLSLLDDLQNIPPLFVDERCFVEFKLIEFYKKVSMKEMYLISVHQLSNRFLKREYYDEAAYLLTLHANLLEFDQTRTVPRMKNFFEEEETEFSRKEKLYNLIIKYLDDGKNYEAGISKCEELIKVYTKLNDYEKLSNTLKTMANFYSKIIGEPRLYAEYFRVGFYGEKFCKFFRNQQFIYKGLPFEKIPSFIDRIMNLHSDTVLLKTNGVPDESIMHSKDEKYIQIVSVKPVVKGEIITSGISSLFDCMFVPESISNYAKNHDIEYFEFQRPFKDPEVKDPINEFSDLCVEKYVLRSEIKFPSILPLSKITEMEKSVIGPIENAILTVDSKSKELIQLAMIAQKNKSLAACSLSMSLLGTIAAAVNGGVEKYQDAFLRVKDNRYDPKDIETLQSVIDQNLLVMERCLEIHGMFVAEDMVPLHQRMVTLLSSMKK